ncbi:MAG: exodeoxyribonuclease VII large subunit [Leptolyngbya sp. SIO1D8]|nr:exodeoxyribonuclease VII large subunit [Leptolyngbya sp. SIO1D8]
MVLSTVSRLFEVPDEALSVAGVTAYIQSLLEQDAYLHRVWVTGEVSSANERNGHFFFTLQEPDGSASIKAVVWRSQRSQLATAPIPGEQIILLGQVRVYPQRGQYQINAVQILPAGAGLQALRRRQLQQRLTAEGLFDDDLKQPLPLYPTQIAVVTSAQAAAWGDIQRTLQKRQPGLQVLLSPAIVQGAQAPESIATAINRVAEDGRADLVILARGGGAREDLDCFDDEWVVRAMVACPMPVITGIGHERDETLADLTADVYAHTPTAAAEQAVPHFEDLWAEHCIRKRAVKLALQSAMQMQYERVAETRRRLEQLRLDQTVQQAYQQLQWLQQQLRQIVQYRLQMAHQQCHHLQQTLQSLDPESVLRRGYAVVRTDHDRILNTANHVNVGETIHIQLAEGAISAQVLTVEAETTSFQEKARSMRHQGKSVP